MYLFFMSKELDNVNLQKLFEKGARLIETALGYMNQAIIGLCENDQESMQDFTQKTIQTEKKLDTIHDAIVERLFTREALVFSREDRLIIATGVDEIVD